MQRGSVYWIQLGKSHPPEMGKTRPGLVISNSDLNESLESVVIVPLSSQSPELWPLRVRVEIKAKAKDTAKADLESFAVIPGIRQVSKSRLQESIGHISEREMQALAEALEAYLSDD